MSSKVSKFVILAFIIIYYFSYTRFFFLFSFYFLVIFCFKFFGKTITNLNLFLPRPIDPQTLNFPLCFFLFDYSLSLKYNGEHIGWINSAFFFFNGRIIKLFWITNVLRGCILCFIRDVHLIDRIYLLLNILIIAIYKINLDFNFLTHQGFETFGFHTFSFGIGI